jgi:prevent-host-death family protein
MGKTISAKTLRVNLGEILHEVRKGARYTVVYRSRPVCQIVPVGESGIDPGKPEEDPLYRARAVGRSRDGRSAADHDEVLYGARR